MSAIPPSAPTAPSAIALRLLALWPAMAERLGERRDAFLASTAEQARRRGLVDAVPAARYANLCFAFGPAFEDRPENEWALAILADERLAPGVRLHQLVWRAVHELRRRGGDEVALQRADAALLDALDLDRRQLDADAQALPRVACDAEAIDLRLLDATWRHEYRKAEGAWQRLPGPPAPPSVRFDATHPAPSQISVLTHAEGEGPAAQLQVRQIVHGGCGERHPGVRWLASHGLSAWHGHEARAVSWPVWAMVQPAPPTGLGVALVEETSPAIGVLETPNCAVRDEGVPLGPLRTQVWAYPAQQWMFALQRDAAPEQTWPVPSPPATAPATRCRIERDGTPVDPRGWVQGFDEGLGAALTQGFERLFEHWKGAVENPRMRVTPGVLTGRSVLTWGWREGPAGLAGAPLMRVLGEVDLAGTLQLTLDGEVESGGARTAVHLAASGSASLQTSVLRERPEPPLLMALCGVVLRWRCPFELQVDPFAQPTGVVCSDAGPCSGVIACEAGLRPRLSGGSGWQWFVRLAVEPVLAPIRLHDPLLGATRRTLALLPALPLVDWSLG